MKFVRKLSIALFLFFLFSALRSQTVEQTVQFADSLFQNGNYESALKNYNRAFFFSQFQNQGNLYLKIGNCLSAEKKYIEAVDAYDKSFAFFDNDSVKTEICLKKAYCFIFSENYLQATAELIFLQTPQNQELQQKINLASATAYFGENDYEKAQTAFKNSVPDSRPDLKNAVDSVFRHINRLNRPNPNLAMVLSSIFPGSGQIFVGDFRNGANAFLLSTLFATIGFRVALIYSPTDAVITIAPWFLRYYKGNIREAKKSANERKSIKKNRIFNQILDVVSKA
jgi:tetratricopeptide (TPR) repeat protein